MSDYYQAFFWNDTNELAMVPPTIKVGSIAILWRVYPPSILILLVVFQRNIGSMVVFAVVESR